MSDQEEEYGEEGIQETPLDYTETNEDGFSRIEYEIYDSLVQSKLNHQKQQVGEEEAEPFDYDGWLESFKEKNPRIDEKYIKYVSVYGIYAGERDEFQVRDGNGKTYFPNGDRYTGSYVEGQRSGSGLYEYRSLGSLPIEEEILKCSSENDQVSALVQEGNFEDAAKLVGTLLRDRVPAQGKQSQMSGPIVVDSFYRIFYTLQYNSPYSFYSGEFQANNNEGQGEMKYSNGDVYKGEWQQGKKHGYGEMYYANGDVYRGEWHEGLKSGSGSYYFSKFNCHYEGEWQNGKFVSGVWKMPDNVYYQGAFDDVPVDVNGEFVFSNGVRMAGEFRDRKFRPSNRFTVESRDQ